jgi:hypothetical protein
MARPPVPFLTAHNSITGESRTTSNAKTDQTHSTTLSLDLARTTASTDTADQCLVDTVEVTVIALTTLSIPHSTEAVATGEAVVVSIAEAVVMVEAVAVDFNMEEAADMVEAVADNTVEAVVTVEVVAVDFNMEEAADMVEVAAAVEHMVAWTGATCGRDALELKASS